MKKQRYENSFFGKLFSGTRQTKTVWLGEDVYESEYADGDLPNEYSQSDNPTLDGIPILEDESRLKKTIGGLVEFTRKMMEQNRARAEQQRIERKIFEMDANTGNLSADGNSVESIYDADGLTEWGRQVDKNIAENPDFYLTDGGNNG